MVDFYQEAALTILRSRESGDPAEAVTRLAALLARLREYPAWTEPDLTLRADIRAYCEWCGLTTDQFEILRDLITGQPGSETAVRMSWLRQEAPERLRVMEDVPAQPDQPTTPITR